MYASILDVSWTLVFQILNFLILLFFISKFLFKPVNEMFEKRKNEIEDNIIKTQREKSAAEDLKKEYEEKILLAKKEADNILQKSTKIANEKSEIIIQEAKEKAKNIEQKSLSEIETQKQNALNEIKSQISTISVLMASKIINKNLNEVDQDGLINEFIESLGE